jgi:hypothetical protein
MTTRHLLQVVACLAVLTASRWAEAQVAVSGSDVAVGYGGLPSKAPQGSNQGVQISDSVLMHTGIGVEAGYDSNVFYADKSDAGGVVGSPILRVLPYLELTNATRGGVVPSGVFFDLNLSMVYREYLSDIQDDKAKRAFMPVLSGLMEFSANQALTLSLADTFIRMEDPPYQPGAGPIVRNMNMAAAQLRWAPGGGRLQSLLRYTNTYDTFETPSLTFADSMAHDLTLDLSWRWLPKTAIFVRGSQGYITYYNVDPLVPKFDSYPLRVLVGIRGLVTRKVSVNLSVGYGNAFYQSPTTTGGVVGSLSATAELGYRPTVLNNLNLGYRHDFQNSVVGNFYYVDSFYGWFQQLIAGRVSAVLSGKYEHRRFQLPETMTMPAAGRTDDFVQAGAAVDYHANGWFYVGVGYGLMINDSTAVLASQSGASFVKHQIFGRLGVTY